jgi:hypothetical protein
LAWTDGNLKEKNHLERRALQAFHFGRTLGYGRKNLMCPIMASRVQSTSIITFLNCTKKGTMIVVIGVSIFEAFN